MIGIVYVFRPFHEMCGFLAVSPMKSPFLAVVTRLGRCKSKATRVAEQNRVTLSNFYFSDISKRKEQAEKRFFATQFGQSTRNMYFRIRNLKIPKHSILTFN